MLPRIVITLCLLTSSMLVPTRCEAEGIDTNPFMGWFHADRLAILHPLQDYECVDGVVGSFKLDEHVFTIIDFECDASVDAVIRDDGLLLLVLPAPPRTLDGKPMSDALRPWFQFDPITDVDWDNVIDDGTPSPFSLESTGRWLDDNQLLALDDGDEFQQPILVNTWSLDGSLADVVLSTTSLLERISPLEYGLEYQWFTARDLAGNLDCWSIRVRGQLEDVARWLIANGVLGINTTSGPLDCACQHIPEREVVECRRGSELVATIELSN